MENTHPQRLAALGSGAQASTQTSATSAIPQSRAQAKGVRAKELGLPAICKRLIISFCLLQAVLHWVALAATPKEGEPFPKLEGFGLQGTVPALSDKIVLVDFFASWCDPCRDSFPVMDQLQRQYGARGLVIIAVNLDQNEADMMEFLKKHPASFTIVRDASKKLVSRIKIPTMPTSFLLDRNGRVHSVHRGFKGEQTHKKYVEEIESLLK